MYIICIDSNMYIPYTPQRTDDTQPFPDLFNNPNFEPFNPNTFDLGGRILHNSTRAQLLDACDK